VISRFVIAAIAAIAMTVAAGAEPMRMAQAIAPDVLPPYEIVTILRSSGFDPIGRPIRRGPDYVLRATDDDGREVRVAVDARSGEIVSVTPVMTASRTTPPGLRMEPDEPDAPDGYIRPPRGVYRSGSPAEYEDEPRVIYGPRGSAQVPQEPPPVVAARPPAAVDSGPIAEPRVIRAPESVEQGLLPPPPERFQRRATTPRGKPSAKPSAKPAPVRRAAALPRQPPLPKPRPGRDLQASPPPSAIKPAHEQLPN
jgi:hypothetical protein